MDVRNGHRPRAASTIPLVPYESTERTGSRRSSDTVPIGETVPRTRILLLTNRDSDNIGDQIIEQSVISLLKAVMKNLDVEPDDYSISSRAAGIITKKYMKTRDESLLADARKEISAADVIVFGGAPLFNYRYQNFYLRTIRTLELAQEYDVPVLFSSIGVEPFDAGNAKSRQLKEALALPCVRQLTTRDDLESARAYAEGTDVPVAQVADPAVFADIVFRSRPKPPAPPASFQTRLLRRMKRIARRVLGRSATTGAASAPPAQKKDSPGRKRIGLVVTRAGIFTDNRIDFTEADQRRFWLDVIDLVTKRGYEYKLFTSGYFEDEVFLNTFLREEGVPASRAAQTINTPEDLIHELKACDGVIAYRLHPSITAFAFKIPSIGLSWNFKVPYFYDSVGYGQRALPPERWKATDVVDALEAAMAEGVTKNGPFLMSVYETLFSGLKEILAPDGRQKPFTYADLRSKLPRYAGTTAALYQEKTKRKQRRIYESYQKYYTYYVHSEGANKLKP